MRHILELLFDPFSAQFQALLLLVRIGEKLEREAVHSEAAAV